MNHLEFKRFATEWIMTLFCRGFSFDLVTRVLDIFCLVGYKIVYRVALALLKTIEEKLMKASFEECMKLIRSLPQFVDAPTLIEVIIIVLLYFVVFFFLSIALFINVCLCSFYLDGL